MTSKFNKGKLWAWEDFLVALLLCEECSLADDEDCEDGSEHPPPSPPPSSLTGSTFSDVSSYLAFFWPSYISYTMDFIKFKASKKLFSES